MAIEIEHVQCATGIAVGLTCAHRFLCLIHSLTLIASITYIIPEYTMTTCHIIYENLYIYDSRLMITIL